MFIGKDEKGGLKEQTEKSDSTTTHDRRYLPRWEVDNKILYQKENEDTYHECRSKDINATGACMRTTEDITPNQQLNLTIYLADDIEPISIHGQTVWRVSREKENLVGIRFDRITEKTSDLIFHYAFEYKKEELMKRWFREL